MKYSLEAYSRHLVDWLNSCGVGAHEIQIAVVQRLKCKIRIYEKQIDSTHKRLPDYESRIAQIKNNITRTKLAIDYIQTIQPTDEQQVI